MDALILCGGYARRLEPITEFIPKSLLFVKDKPIVDHVIDHTSKMNVNRVIVSTNKRFSGQFNYWLNMQKASGNKNIELVVEPTIDHEERFGNIRGIAYAIKNAKLNEDLLIIAGDNYFEFDITNLTTEFSKKRKPIIALYDVKDIEEAKRFGVVSIDRNNKITDFEEKPEEPKSTLVSTGIYIYPKEHLNKFKEYLDQGNSPDGLGLFFKWLINNEEVYGHVYSSKPWFDVGTLTVYRKLFYQDI